MKYFHFLLLSLICLVAAGCGGGGGSSSQAQARIFVTDNLGNYDHVWVTVKQVDLVGPSGSHTVFVSAAGEPLDLPALNVNGVQHFAFLGLKSLPAGTYTSMVFTLDENVVLYPHNATTGLNRTFANANGGLATVSLSLSSGEVAGKTDFVADFDLSQWNDDGTHVTAAVKEGDKSGLGDGSKHEKKEYEGQIANLQGTAPNFTFDLSQECGTPLHVSVDGSTEVFNSDGSDNPTLANAERVHLKGTFNVDLGVLAASSVKIQVSGGGEGDDQPEATGAVTWIGQDSFNIDILEAHGFVPSGTGVHVFTGPDAVFFGDGGVTISASDFYAKLALGVHVEVEGSYNSDTNVFTATRLKFAHDGDGGGSGGDGSHEAMVAGPPASVNADAGTFDLTVVLWQGGSLHVGDVVHVSTTNDTEYRDAAGNEIDRATFYAASYPHGLIVVGNLSGNNLVAEKVKIKAD